MSSGEDPRPVMSAREQVLRSPIMPQLLVGPRTGAEFLNPMHHALGVETDDPKPHEPPTRLHFRDIGPAQQLGLPVRPKKKCTKCSIQ
jgi:hypothetical protein